MPFMPPMLLSLLHQKQALQSYASLAPASTHWRVAVRTTRILAVCTMG